MYYQFWRGALAAWIVTVLISAGAMGLAIEHPEFLSMPLMPFSLLVSTIIVGVPFGFGLCAVQGPAFFWAVKRWKTRRAAWTVSTVANALYAMLLGVGAFLLHQLIHPGPANLPRAMLTLAGLSLITSAI